MAIENSPHDRSKEKNESNIFFFLKLVIHNWKKLFVLYVVVSMISVVTLLLLPEWYRASATVVILDERGTSGISTALTEMIPFNLGMIGSINTDRYLQFTKTKKLQDRVINEFNLNDVYETKFIEDTYRAFNDNLFVHDNDNNTINISFTYKEDPVKAAEITNFIYIVLHDIALEIDKAQASNFREYLERYLDTQQQNLKETREKMIRFQNESGILELETQMEATIRSLADIEVMRTETMFQIEYLSRITSEQNVELRNLQLKYESLSRQIENLKKHQEMPLLSIDGLPERASEYLEILRDLTIGEQVTEFVRVQYEEALIDEQKISSNLYLLDPAQVPEKKYKPKRMRSLISIMFFTVLLSLIYVRIKYFYQENEDEFKKLWNN